MFKRGLTPGAVGFVAALAMTAATATGEFLYATNRDGSLFTVDLVTAEAQFVAALPHGATEIEYSPDTGRAFAQAPDGTFAGTEFDIETGVPLGPTLFNGGSFTGLEFVGLALYGTVISGGGGETPSELRILDPSTGVSDLVGLTGTGAISGLAFDETAQVLYGIRGGSGPADLLSLDLSTGLASVIGSTGIRAGSLEFGANGVLYAGGTGADQGMLYSIDPQSGASHPVGDTGMGPLTGLASTTFNQPPDCSSAAADPDVLWPPDHKFKKVAIHGVSDPDGDPTDMVITRIAQDEPVNDSGDGKTAPDAKGLGSEFASLRRERSGSGDGRTYHLSFRAEDEFGGVCEGTLLVCVPRNHGAGDGCVDQGPLYDSLTGEVISAAFGPEDCGDGFELVAMLPPMVWLRARRRRVTRGSGRRPLR